MASSITTDTSRCTKGALSSLMSEPSSSKRAEQAKEQVKKFLEATVSNERCLSAFDNFSSKLSQTLDKCFVDCIGDVSCRSKNVQCEKIWSSFHKLRCSTSLRKLWADVCKEIDSPMLSPLTYQMVTQTLYSNIITNHYSHRVSKSTVEDDIPSLTVNEENVIRYVAGYIPFKLLRKYEEKSTPAMYSVEVVECLHAMAVNGEESNLMDYTREWCLKVDRGGLFEVNDSAYLLFRELELQVRKELIVTLSKGSHDEKNKKDTIANAVAANDDVQFYWTLLSVEITDEQKAIDLLRDMILLWITIRGFSIAKAWLEQYLPGKKVIQKGLRKELKKNSDSS